MVYDYDNKHLYLAKNNGVVFDFHLRGNSHIYVIFGDSGTGKTYLFNSIKEMQELSRTYTGVEDVSNILLINMHTGTDEILKVSHKLVIIDDADNILVPNGKMVMHINEDTKNHYLIFMRQSVGLRITPNYGGKIVSSNGVITIEWLANVGRWF